jgi:hypothetical protein
MVRVDRLYLGPMFSPDQLGSDKIKPIVEIGSRIIACSCVCACILGLLGALRHYWSFVETVANKCLRCCTRIQKQNTPNHQNRVQRGKQKNYRVKTIPVPKNGRVKDYAKAEVIKC